MFSLAPRNLFLKLRGDRLKQSSTIFSRNTISCFLFGQEVDKLRSKLVQFSDRCEDNHFIFDISQGTYFFFLKNILEIRELHYFLVFKLLENLPKSRKLVNFTIPYHYYPFHHILVLSISQKKNFQGQMLLVKRKEQSKIKKEFMVTKVPSLTNCQPSSQLGLDFDSLLAGILISQLRNNPLLLIYIRFLIPYH